MKVQDRKRESVVHHDRLKLCHDRSLPLWMRRLRHGLLVKTPDLAGDLGTDKADAAEQVEDPDPDNADADADGDPDPVDHQATRMEDGPLDDAETPEDENEDLGLGDLFAESEERVKPQCNHGLTQRARQQPWHLDGFQVSWMDD